MKRECERCRGRGKVVIIVQRQRRLYDLPYLRRDGKGSMNRLAVAFLLGFPDGICNHVKPGSRAPLGSLGLVNEIALPDSLELLDSFLPRCSYLMHTLPAEDCFSNVIGSPDEIKQVAAAPLWRCET